MFRLAHISDVHLRPLPKVEPLQLFNKRIIGYLNWKLNRRKLLAGDYLGNLISDMATKTPDHIVVTGDLTNISLPGEFDQAAKFLKLLGEPKNVTTLLGNHDAYISGSSKLAINKLQNYVSGDDAAMIDTSSYPVLIKRNNVAIIGCNSAEATMPFFATGYFRQEQADKLASMLEDTKDMCRIVMIHHPPFENATYHHKRLIGRDLFQQVIAEKGAELILHGHTHKATRNEIAGPQKPVPVICVPAAGHAHDVNDHPAGRYNLFTITGDQSLWSIKMEEYGLAAGTDGISLVGSHQF